MRKIRSHKRYRKAQEQKHRRFLYTTNRRRLARSILSQRYKAYEKVLTKDLHVARVKAPENFSFINEPEKMIEFVGQLKHHLLTRKRSVLVDLTSIQEITNDALILMLSVVQDPRVAKGIRSFVKLPPDDNSKISNRLKESGIREQLSGLEDVVPAKSGRIRNKWSLQADTTKANELIAFATTEVFGKRSELKDVQRILSECVDNTTFHASGKRDKKLEEAWWATVFCEGDPKVAYFSVLDNGFGILRHLKINWMSELKLLGMHGFSPTKVMQSVFAGGVLSSTGESNRGNGLPTIYKARSRGQFNRLIVITNNVYIDFDKEIYRKLPRSFAGTFFYWEVRQKNGH